MTIAATVKSYLDGQGVSYEVVAHPQTPDSSHSAEAAHVPGDQLAKCVLLEDAAGHLMAIIPATHKLDLGVLRRQLNRSLGLATEEELSVLFSDCDRGAIPPLGKAYGIDAIVDESLISAPDVYFEGGDHCALVHVSGEDFRRLLRDAPRGLFSHRLQPARSPHGNPT